MISTLFDDSAHLSLPGDEELTNRNRTLTMSIARVHIDMVLTDESASVGRVTKNCHDKKTTWSRERWLLTLFESEECFSLLNEEELSNKNRTDFNLAVFRETFLLNCTLSDCYFEKHLSLIDAGII